MINGHGKKIGLDPEMEMEIAWDGWLDNQGGMEWTGGRTGGRTDESNGLMLRAWQAFTEALRAPRLGRDRI
jgi:hypothetical protein